MKFGIIVHTETSNLGDDIQSYAAAKLLPQIDYVIDREHLDTFRSKDNEPVQVVMAHWWFWQKWNWPPANCIVPLLISMHINNYDIFTGGTPFKDRWLTGIGEKYMKAYGPVGVRDMTTLDFLKERGFDAYFSGCITLTLPKQKKTKDAGQYVCLVDLNDKLKKKAYELLKDSGLRIVEVTHRIEDRYPGISLKSRFKEVEDVLTLYQNAKFVITRRLHVSLPCLAMEVPVLSVVDLSYPGNYTRWSPYAEWLHYVSNEDFLAGNIPYDFENPPMNKSNYLETRNFLINKVDDFINQYKENTLSTEALSKVNYTGNQVYAWQNQVMKETLDDWVTENHKMLKMHKDYDQKLQKLRGSLSEELPENVQELIKKKPTLSDQYNDNLIDFKQKMKNIIPKRILFYIKKKRKSL